MALTPVNKGSPVRWSGRSHAQYGRPAGSNMLRGTVAALVGRTLAVAVGLAAACQPDGPVPVPPATPLSRPVIAWVRGDDPRLRIEGRFARSPEGPRFAWPASTVHLRFRGRTLELRLRDTLLDDRVRDHDALGVFIDGAPASRLTLREGDAEYRVAMRLPSGEHDVALVKLTEAEAGTVTLLGVGTDGVLRAPPPALPRRILAIGDSITAGYGVAGPTGCHFSSEFADASRAWVTLAARTLDAEVHVLAWSGRGVLWNYNPEPDPLMTELMERTLPGDPSSTCDWQAFVPDAVVLNLGTNDVIRPEFDADAFARAYGSILDRLRRLYPRARLVAALGPMITDDDPTPGTGRLTRMRVALQGLVRDRQAGGDAGVRFLELVPGDPSTESCGCDQHPSALTHARLAGVLVDALSDIGLPLAPSATVASRGPR